MTIFNLEGSTIFGPGSEWFWAMAQFVLVAATIVGIYFQLRAQHAASLIEQSREWVREWGDDVLTADILAALIDLQERPAVASGLPEPAKDVANWFEALGYLVAERHLRSIDVWHHMRPDVALWWALLTPYVKREREIGGSDHYFEWFEKLELEMERLDRKITGKTWDVDGELQFVGQWIDELSARLRRHADARNGIFPSRRVELPPVTN